MPVVFDILSGVEPVCVDFSGGEGISKRVVCSCSKVEGLLSRTSRK